LFLKLSSGNLCDITIAESLLESLNLYGKTVIADKGYDSGKLVKYIEDRGGVAVIPCRSLNRVQRAVDKSIYSKRHLVENLFLKLKNHRRFATRYEKSAAAFFALSLFAATLVWLD